MFKAHHDQQILTSLGKWTWTERNGWESEFGLERAYAQDASRATDISVALAGLHEVNPNQARQAVTNQTPLKIWPNSESL